MKKAPLIALVAAVAALPNTARAQSPAPVMMGSLWARSNGSFVPEGVSVHLTLPKSKFLIGEHVPLTIIVQNDSPKVITLSLGGDSRNTWRALRYLVTATDSLGHKLADPEPEQEQHCFGGLGGDVTIAPGKTWSDSLYAEEYVRFDQPGTYTVQASHDFGWKFSAQHPYPKGEIRLSIAEPTAAEAETLLASKSAETHYLVNTRYLWSPAYLPALTAQARQGDTDAVAGIGSVATPEATTTLISLLDASSADIRKSAGEALVQRLPEIPKNLNPWDIGDQTTTRRYYLVTKGWNASLAGDVRAAAQRLLQGNAAEINRGAHLLERVGTADDMPVVTTALAAAMTRLPSVPEAGFAGQEPPYFELTSTVNALLERGAKVPANPRTTGEQATFLLALKRGETAKTFHETAAQWAIHQPLLTSSTPCVRVLAWEALQAPLPPKAVPVLRTQLPALFHDREPLVRIKAFDLAATLKATDLLPTIHAFAAGDTDEMIQSAAENALVSLAGKTRGYSLWVDKLDDPRVENPKTGYMASIVWRLNQLFVYRDSWGVPDPSSYSVAEIHAFQQRWRAFLGKHRAEIDAGHRWKLTDPDMPHDLVAPYSILDPPETAIR